MWSFWEQESFLSKIDIVVVGSGIVGLNAALEIKKIEPKLSVVVLEAGPLPSGASTKNAGFACFGSPTELLMDLEHTNSDEVFALVKKRLEGLNYLRSLIGDASMNYQTPGSYELFEAEDETFEKAAKNLNFLNEACQKSIGFRPYSIIPDLIKNNGFNGFSKAIRIQGEGQINTGMMMKKLITLAKESGIEIINGIKVKSCVQESNSIRLSTENGDILCNKCLVATNGFAQELLNKPVEPARAQVLITNELRDIPFKGTYHFDSGYYYFRNVGNRVLLGGGRNLDFEKETSSKNELNTKIHEELDRLLTSKILPNTSFEIEQRWTGIMGVGGNKSPYIEQINERLYCAVKLGGMGVAIGSTTGVEAARLLLQS